LDWLSPHTVIGKFGKERAWRTKLVKLGSTDSIEEHYDGGIAL